MSAQKVNKSAKEVFIYVVFLFILLLTAINISTFLQPQTKVLGITSQENMDEEFWREFLEKHPSYIPGWIEIERLDKVKEIDPNYF